MRLATVQLYRFNLIPCRLYLSVTLQRSLLHYLPALFNYCSMRELVILLVIY